MFFKPNIQHGCEHCQELEQLIEKNKSEIQQTLIGDVRHINHRAECHNGIQVECVQYHSTNEYLLDYSYEWSVYNECADLAEEGQEDDSISFTVEKDGRLVFDFLELDERSPHYEF